MAKDVVAGWVDDKDLRDGDVDGILNGVAERRYDRGQRRVGQEEIWIVKSALVDK